MHSPTQLGREQAETVFEVSVPNARVVGDEDGSRVASRAAAASASAHGAAQRAEDQEGSDSNDPNYECYETSIFISFLDYWCNGHYNRTPDLGKWVM